jgi:hypothetical protein
MNTAPECDKVLLVQAELDGELDAAARDLGLDADEGPYYQTRRYDRYREVLTFPIQEYYRSIGFDFDHGAVENRNRFATRPFVGGLMQRQFDSISEHSGDFHVVS